MIDGWITLEDGTKLKFQDDCRVLIGNRWRAGYISGFDNDGRKAFVRLRSDVEVGPFPRHRFRAAQKQALTS